MTEFTYINLVNDGLRLNSVTHALATVWGITLSDAPVYIGAQWGMQ